MSEFIGFFCFLTLLKKIFIFFSLFVQGWRMFGLHFFYNSSGSGIFYHSGEVHEMNHMIYVI